MPTQPDLRTTRFVSDRELAYILGCSRSTVWRHAANGGIPKPVRIGGLTRFNLLDVLTAIQNAVGRAPSEPAAHENRNAARRSRYLAISEALPRNTMVGSFARLSNRYEEA